MSETEELTRALREIIERWDGADDCTAAVARAKALLVRLEARRG